MTQSQIPETDPRERIVGPFTEYELRELMAQGGSRHADRLVTLWLDSHTERLAIPADSRESLAELVRRARDARLHTPAESIVDDWLAAHFRTDGLEVPASE